MIYISEAHAVDVWPIGMSAGTLNYKHQTINDRFRCAIKMKETFKLDIPIYLDNMDNQFETTYSSWPFRYYVVKNHKLIMIPSPKDSEFIFQELFNFLENLESNDEII